MYNIYVFLFIEVNKAASTIPRTSSDVGLFTRLKNACLSSARSSTQDLTSQPSHYSADDKLLSRSTSDIHDHGMESEEEKIWKDSTVSKSCNDLRFSFKDESDIDISSLLDERFGTVLQVRESMISMKDGEEKECNEEDRLERSNCVPSQCSSHVADS